jgi:hypothetical protein
MVFWRLLAKGDMEMASKPETCRRKQSGYLATYFVLLLFSIIALAFQGGVWVLAGLACWSCAIFGWFYYYNKNINAKCLRSDSLVTGGYIEGEEGKGYVS